MRKAFKMNQIDESTYVNPEQTAINNSVENYIQKQNQKLKEEINSITDCINNDEDNIPAIPETFFKDIFLPLFLGNPRTYNDPVTNSEKTIDFTDWLRVCQGSYTTYVKVVDDLDINKTLFLVPPLYNTKIIKMKSQNNSEDPHPISLTNVFIDANERKYNSPMLAEMIIKNETVKLINELDEETIAKDKKLWNDIFKRYNMIEEKPEDKKSEEDKKSALDCLEWDF
jgi:hypothetical protein